MITKNPTTQTFIILYPLHRKKKRGHGGPRHCPVQFPWQGGGGAAVDMDAATGRMKYMSIMVNDDAGSPGNGGAGNAGGLRHKATKERSIEISAVDMQYGRKSARGPVHHHNYAGESGRWRYHDTSFLINRKSVSETIEGTHEQTGESLFSSRKNVFILF
jgi:hypothetical protein